MQVYPVAADVDDHAELEAEGPARVERAQRGQQGHGAAPVRQHVQHGAELGALVQGPGRVAVESVQQAGEDVAPSGDHVVGRHEPGTKRGCHEAHVESGDKTHSPQ